MATGEAAFVEFRACKCALGKMLAPIRESIKSFVRQTHVRKKDVAEKGFDQWDIEG